MSGSAFARMVGRAHIFHFYGTYWPEFVCTMSIRIVTEQLQPAIIRGGNEPRAMAAYVKYV